MFDTSYYRSYINDNSNSLKIPLSNDQIKWQSIATELAHTYLASNAAQIDESGTFPRENFTRLATSGLLSLNIPSKYDGPSGNVLTTTLVTESLAQGCASTAMCYHMHISATSLLVALANEEQAKVFIPPLLRGEKLYTYATSEPGSGSRWWHMDGFARREGEEYVLNAFKSFATSAGHVDYYIIPVRATPTSHPNEMSLFIVPAGGPDVQVVGTWNGMGMRGNSSSPVKFEHCHIPNNYRLGDSGFGFPLLMAYSFPIFHVGLAAVYLGIAQLAYDTAITHVSQRIHPDTGEPLSKVETVKRYLAEMKIRLDQTRLMVYRVAQWIDEAQVKYGDLIGAAEDISYILAIGEVKISSCETALDVTHKALQLCGGTAYKRGHIIERCYRDARAGSIMGPNDDALKVLIGQLITGQPLPWSN